MEESSVENSTSEESLIGSVADEFLQRQSRGERPDIEEYAARHPQAANVLRKVLASIHLLDDSHWAGDGSRPSSAEPPLTLGDFRIERELGRGGMGIVYEAEQVSLGRRVALKILPLVGVLDARRLERFRNESRAAAGLHHSSIVPVYSIGCEHGVHYYAMQFIEGATLANIVREIAGESTGENCSAAETSTARNFPTSGKNREHCRGMARLAIIAAEALEYAHQQGVIHRDVKPANLMLDKDGRLWITDFGLARVQTDVGVTVTGDVLGTLRYMSPEQILGRRGMVDERSDVYSLGATLYELLTLRPAFPGDDRGQLLSQIASDDPPSPRSLNANIPAELETIVLKCLEKSPLDRYATAGGLADDLRRHLENRPILAQRPSVAHRAAKWFRRHRALSAALGVAVAMLMLAAVIGSITYANAQSEKARRRLAINGRIAEALADAVRALEGANSLADDALARERARELVREAVTLSENEWADGQLGDQSRQLLAELDAESNDRQLLATLEEAWLGELLADNRDHQFQFDRVAEIIAEAFARWGLTPLNTRLDDAAKVILDRPPGMQRQLIPAFHRWSRTIARRKEPGAMDADLRRWLEDLIEQVDSDPWRGRLRKALNLKQAIAKAFLARLARRVRGRAEAIP